MNADQRRFEIPFELFVAARYLRAKRKQAVISLITGISVLGVAAGVMALVIALAINAGFRNTLQRNLLGATAHVMVLQNPLSKEPNEGIRDWRELTARLAKMPHVVSASPSLYGNALIPGGQQPGGAVIKGVLAPGEAPLPRALQRLKSGSVDGWREKNGMPVIILGSRLAEARGLRTGDVVRLINPEGEMTPMGAPRFFEHHFYVGGIFESGFFDLDSLWAFTSLKSVQQLMAVGDVINAVDINIDDVYRADDVAEEISKQVGPKLTATHWMEQNRQLLNALKMERAVTVVTIGLIQLVAALNIFTSLVMMVMEKHRDIAILMSMGARREQISRIFRLQGALIGIVGTAIGLAFGYTISYLADRYRWIELEESVYSLSYVPFEPRPLDALWIGGAAIVVSLLATLYPARSASRIAPVEALRYE